MTIPETETSNEQRAPWILRAVYRRLRALGPLTFPLALFDQAFRARGYLRDSGWLESYRRNLPIAGGNPIPFYTYAAISFLASRVDKRMSVFEYGSGYSTLWWATRAQNVVSCEHDQGWFERMQAMAPQNVHMIHRPLIPDGEYCRTAAAFRSDIIVVDGRDRVNCAKACLAGLTDAGVIIWDNSDRPRYQEGYDFLRSHGFRTVDFRGLGPIDPWPWMTSIYYRDNNCLSL